MATTVPNNPFDVQPESPKGQGIVGGAISNVTTGQNATAQNLAQYNPLQNLSVQQYTPQTREVNRATETAAGQVESLLANDNPLMQRARTLALQNMNQRGLVNSSMAQGAGVAAMVDRITPIAQQDAEVYSNRALANMDATNRANEFNVGQNNQLFSQGLNIASQFGLQDLSQKFQTAEREANQTFQTGEREATQKFQSYESLLQREFTAEENNLDRVQQTRIVELQEAGANRRQAETIAAQERAQASQQAFERAQAAAAQQFQAQQAELQRAQEQALAQAQIQANKELQAAQQSFQGAQAELERAQQVALADKSIAAQQALQSAQQSFQSAQAELDRTQQTNIANTQIQANKELAAINQAFTEKQAELDRKNQIALAEFSANAQNAAVAKTFALNTASNVNNSINAVLADPNINSADKTGAIDNVVKAGNATLQWGATFYNTTLPTITTPGGTPGTVSPGPGAGAGNAATKVNSATSTSTANTQVAAKSPVSAAEVKAYVSNVLAGSGSDAQKAAAINQAAAANGVSREQIAAATGYSLKQVNDYLK